MFFLPQVSVASGRGVAGNQGMRGEGEGRGQVVWKVCVFFLFLCSLLTVWPIFGASFGVVRRRKGGR